MVKSRTIYFLKVCGTLCLLVLSISHHSQSRRHPTNWPQLHTRCPVTHCTARLTCVSQWSPDRDTFMMQAVLPSYTQQHHHSCGQLVYSTIQLISLHLCAWQHVGLLIHNFFWLHLQMDDLSGFACLSTASGGDDVVKLKSCRSCWVQCCFLYRLSHTLYIQYVCVSKGYVSLDKHQFQIKNTSGLWLYCMDVHIIYPVKVPMYFFKRVLFGSLL